MDATKIREHMKVVGSDGQHVGIVDGIEGDLVEERDSVFYGKRMKNGWKNSAPWGYTIDPEKISLPVVTQTPGRWSPHSAFMSISGVSRIMCVR